MVSLEEANNIHPICFTTKPQEYIKVETNYKIKLPTNSIVECPIVYKYVPICVGATIFQGDFIQLNLSGFDIILGINWLHTYEVKIDCKNVKVILNDEKGRELWFYGQRKEKPCPLISAMKVSKLFVNGVLGTDVMR